MVTAWLSKSLERRRARSKKQKGLSFKILPEKDYSQFAYNLFSRALTNVSSASQEEDWVSRPPCVRSVHGSSVMPDC